MQEKSCFQPLYLSMELKELQKGYKLIEYGDLKVAVSCEVEFENIEYDGFEIYSPGSYLLYVVQGNVKIDHEHTSHHFPQGSFCLVRKYTNIRYSQTAAEDGGRPKTYKFALGDGFIKKIISEI